MVHKWKENLRVRLKNIIYYSCKALHFPRNAFVISPSTSRYFFIKASCLLMIHPRNLYNLISNFPSWFLQHQSRSQVVEHASFEHISDEPDIFRASESFSAIRRHALLHRKLETERSLKLHAQMLCRTTSVLWFFLTPSKWI